MGIDITTLLQQAARGAAGYMAGQREAADARERNRAAEEDRARRRREDLERRNLNDLLRAQRERSLQQTYRATAGGVTSEFGTPEEAQAFVQSMTPAEQPEKPFRVTVDGVTSNFATEAEADAFRKRMTREEPKSEAGEMDASLASLMLLEEIRKQVIAEGVPENQVDAEVRRRLGG